MNWFKVTGLSLMFLGLIAALISGCATTPYVAPPRPEITINTIPSGADISIGGNYMGKSPLVWILPSYRGTTPLHIEAVLDGYEPKAVSFGYYHPPIDEPITNSFGTYLGGTRTAPAYYTFGNEINIKLQPKK